ncbi:Hormone-sensitive lipase [Smittium culicis]|uniref:Hormone-sensitive lipase n=1 Tax=Smittium culicis TaxID=133412 RepID=A0A1R1YC33_9FUNG|nr:Hormone-sensitive lipase [Smittium culicis]
MLDYLLGKPSVRVRRLQSIVIALSAKGEEKVRKFRSLITAEHMRVSWGKGSDNPFFRLLRWSKSKRLTIHYCTYIPNSLGDSEIHRQVCLKQYARPWNLRWWFDYDPSFGIEGGMKSSELSSSLNFNNPKFMNLPKVTRSESADSNSSFSTTEDGTKPALCYVMYAHEKENYKKTKNIILNFPGGGFVSMSPPCHDDYLSEWAYQNDAIIVSVDYAKSPEYPYPYAIDQCFEVYKSLTKTNGRCIGLELDNDEKVSIIIIGDSAGGNITASTMFKIIESEDELPLPKGLVFIYGLFNFDIRAWMSTQEMDMVNGVTITANSNSTSGEKNPASLILDPKDHLQHISPLAFNKISNAFQYTALSWLKKNLSISDRILLVKNDEKNPTHFQSDDDTNYQSNSETSDDDLQSEPHRPEIKSNSHNHRDQPDSRSRDLHSSNRSSSSELSDTGSEVPHHYLSMTSRFTYFSDMILTPEMMRAMAILYIGPNNTPDFEKDYYLSPIVAPEELLAKFPNTYFMCGEKDPLVDDTVIFAGRIRDAKAKLKAKNLSKNFTSFTSKNKSDVKISLNVQKDSDDSSDESHIQKHSPRASKHKKLHKSKNPTTESKSAADNSLGPNVYHTYKPYRRHRTFGKEYKKLETETRGFYIGDSSNPTSAETSEAEDSDFQDSDNSITGRRSILKSLWMTKFSSSSNNLTNANQKEHKLSENSNSADKQSIERSPALNRSNNSSENNDGIWDLTSTENKSIHKVYSQAQLNSILKRNNSSLTSLEAESARQSVQPEDSNMQKTQQEIEYLENLSSTLIKVKILEGMSHGYMQMGSIFPESHSAIKTIGGWLDELFNIENDQYTEFTRSGSVLNNYNFKESNLEEGIIAKKGLNLSPMTKIVSENNSNLEDFDNKVNNKNQMTKNDQDIKIKTIINSNRPSVKESANSKTNIVTDEDLIKNGSIDLTPIVKNNPIDSNIYTSISNELQDRANERESTSGTIADNEFSIGTDDYLGASKDLNSRQNKKQQLKRTQVTLLAQKDQKSTKSTRSDISASSDKASSNGSVTPKQDEAKANSAVDRHGNVVVSSSEMMRRRGNHLLENLGKGV